MLSQNNTTENIVKHKHLQNKAINFLSKSEIQNKLSKLKNGETAKINNNLIKRIIHNFSTGFYSEQKQNLTPYKKAIKPFNEKTKVILKNTNSFNSTNLKVLSGISTADFNNTKDVIVIDGNNELLFKKTHTHRKNKMFSGTINLENYEKTKVVKLSENKFVVLNKKTKNGQYISKKQALKEISVEQKRWIVNGNSVYFIKSFKMDGWIKTKNSPTLLNIKTFNYIWFDLNLKINSNFTEINKNEWVYSTKTPSNLSSFAKLSKFTSNTKVEIVDVTNVDLSKFELEGNTININWKNKPSFKGYHYEFQIGSNDNTWKTWDALVTATKAKELFWAPGTGSNGPTWIGQQLKIKLVADAGYELKTKKGAASETIATNVDVTKFSNFKRFINGTTVNSIYNILRTDFRVTGDTAHMSWTTGNLFNVLKNYGMSSEQVVLTLSTSGFLKEYSLEKLIKSKEFDPAYVWFKFNKKNTNPSIFWDIRTGKDSDDYVLPRKFYSKNITGWGFNLLRIYIDTSSVDMNFELSGTTIKLNDWTENKTAISPPKAPHNLKGYIPDFLYSIDNGQTWKTKYELMKMYDGSDPNKNLWVPGTKTSPGSWLASTKGKILVKLRYNSKDAFLSNDKQTSFDLSSFTKLLKFIPSKIKIVDVTNVDLSKFELEGNTMNIDWKNKPSFKGYHYEFQLGSNDNIWKTWDALVTATKAKELFWAPGTGSNGPTWIGQQLKIKLVADDGYALKTKKGEVSETLSTNVDVTKFSNFKRFITSKMINDLQKIVSTDLHVNGDTEHMSWTTGNIFNVLKNYGISLIQTNEKNASHNSTSTLKNITQKQKMNPDMVLISADGSLHRSLTLEILKKSDLNYFLDPSANLKFNPKTGYETLPMYIDTSSIDMNFKLSGTTTKLNDWTEKNTDFKGYTPDFLYSIDNGQTWKTKHELMKMYDGSDPNKNLWVPGTKTSPGSWLASTKGKILVKLKPSSITAISTDKQTSFDFSSFTKLLKFIPDTIVDSMLTEIKKDVHTKGGNSTTVIWESIQAIIDFANNAGLLIEFAASKDGKYSSILPTAIDADTSKRQLWVRINPKKGFTLSVNKTQNNKTDITQTANLSHIKQEVDVTNVNLSKFELEGNTMNINWKNKPSFKGYHYEFQIGSNDNTWKTWDALVTATKAKELFWAPGTGSNGPTWIGQQLKIKLVADAGYELKTKKGAASETIATNVDVTKFSNFKRFITSKMINDLQKIVSTDLHVTGDTEHMSWTTGNIFNVLKNYGISLIQTNEKNASHNSTSTLKNITQKQKMNPDMVLISADGSLHRSLTLEILKKSDLNYFLDPSANLKFNPKTGYETLPMYIDTSSIDMNFKLSGTTTKLNDWTEKNTDFKGYTPDFLYSIDNGQTWKTKHELMKMYDGSDPNKNLWVPGTKTSPGSWLASTKGKILVKLKPSSITVLSTDKKTPFDFSSFTKLLKFIPDTTVDSILTEIKKDVHTEGGNDKTVIWSSIQAIINFANNAGLLIEFAASKDGKYSSTLPTAIDADPSKRQLWVRINPKKGFTLSVNKTQNNKTDITQTANLSRIKQEVDVTNVNLSKFELEGNTMNIEWKNKPSFKGYHYEFQLGSNDNTWKTWDALVTATKAKELFWAPGTGSNGPTWIGQQLKIKLVADVGYELKTKKGTASETIVTNVDVTKFSNFKRFITSKMINDLQKIVSTDLHVTGDTEHMSWTTGNILNFLKNNNLFIQATTHNNSAGGRTITTSFLEILKKQKMNPDMVLISVDGSIYRKFKLELLDNSKKIVDYVIDPSANPSLDSKTGYETLPMYIDTSSIDMNFELSGSTTKLNDWIEKNTTFKGYTPDFLYSIDNGQTWKTKHELMKMYDGSDPNKNLWVPGTKTSTGSWLASTKGKILVKLKPSSITVLSTEKQTSFDFSSFTKLLKFIPDTIVDSMLTEIKKDVHTKGGNSTTVIWESIQAIIDFANNAGLLIEFAASKDGKYSSILPTAIDADTSKRQLWVRINPKKGFTLSVNKTQNNKTDITQTANLSHIKQEVDVTNVNLSKFELEGNTMNINWKNKPSFKGYHYEFQIGSNDNTWKTWDALVTATKAKELFWAPGTGSNGPTWIGQQLKIKLVADAGYELKTKKGAASETIATNVDVTKFSNFKRFITSKMINDLQKIVSTDLHVTGDTEHMSWTTGNIFNVLKNYGISLIQTNEKNASHNSTSTLKNITQKQKMNPDMVLISADGSLHRSLTLEILKKSDLNYFLDPSANLKFNPKTGYETLPMYIDTSSIDMNFKLSGTTTKLNDWTEKNTDFKGYTPDFLYSIDNGQTWKTKHELMKMYDGSDPNKNLWVPGTKTSPGSWLASTKGKILVKLKPSSITVLSTDKKTPFDFSSFTKLLKFIPDTTVDSILTEIKKDVHTEGGNDKTVIWSSIQAIINFANNAGLLIEFAASKDGKYSSTLPTAIDADPSKRQLWVRINPKKGFTLSVNKTQNNKTDITQTANLSRIKQEVDVTNVNLSKFELEGNTMNIEWKNKPSFKGYHYEFQLGSNDNTWKTWDALVTATKAKELFWAPGTGSNGPTWIGQQLKIKLVADVGYELKTKKGTASETIVTNVDVTKFSNFKRFITSKMINDLQKIVSTDLHVTGDTEHMSWTTGNILNFLKNNNLFIQATTHNNSAGGRTITTSFLEILKKQKMNPDMVLISVDGSIYRKFKLELLDNSKKIVDYVIDPSANPSLDSKTGYETLPMYIDTSSIDMNFELSGSTTKLNDWIEKNTTFKGYTPDFLYSIDNGQTWKTKHELMKMYDGSDPNKNLWVPGTKTSTGSWLASTKGKILVKLKPSSITVLSTEKQTSFDFSSFTKLLKFIPDTTVEAVLTEVKNGVKTDGGNDKKVIWKSIQSIIDFAENTGLLIEFAISKDGKYSSTLPTAIDADPSKRQLWVRINPKKGFTLSGIKTKNNRTNITKTADLFRIKQEVDVTNVNLSKFELEGNTNDLIWKNKPAKQKEYHYEFKLIAITATGQKDTSWFTWDQLVLQNKTNKLLFKSGTLNKEGYWIRDNIEVKLVANNGYILKKDSNKPASETSSVKFNIKKMNIKKIIDAVELEKLKKWLESANGIKASGTHLQVTWSNVMHFKEITKNLSLETFFNTPGNTSLPTQVDFWSKNRSLNIIVKAKAGFIILPALTSLDFNITNPSGIKAIPTYIDTSQVDTGSIQLTGTTIKLDDWTESNNLSYPTTVVDYIYSIDQGQKWLSKTQLFTKYSQNNESINLWVPGTANGAGHWITSSNGELLVKLIPHVEIGQHYKISSNKRAAIKFSSFTKLLKYIPLSTFTTITELAKDPVKGILPDKTSLNNKIIWLNIKEIMQFAQFAGFQLSFSKTLDPKLVKWVDTIPTDTLFEHGKRELYMKAKTLDGFTTSNVVSTPKGIIDLTTTSKIRSILSVVNISSKDLTSFKLTGDTNAMKFINLQSEPKGSKLEFSLDNGANWIDKQKFISELKAKPSAFIPSHFKVRFNELDKTKFKLTDGSGNRIDKETNIDVSKLFLYKNVSSFKTLMITDAGIELSGQLSSTNGVQVKIGNELIPSELAKKGIKMQYTLDGQTWIDVPALSTISADPLTGISGGPNSFKITVAKPKTGLPILSFRLTPFKDWNGKAVSNSKNSDYNEWTKLTRVHLSDFVAAGNKVDAINVSKSKQASRLPTLVNTNNSDLSNISVSGDTRHIVVSENIGNITIANVLKKLNPTSTFNFGQFIQPTFALSSLHLKTAEGKGHWFLRDDFIDWLNGNITWNGQHAVNKKNKVVKVWEDGSEKPTDLKKQDIRPKWNVLRSKNIKARWNSNNKLYRPTNRNELYFNKNNTKVKTWIDLTSYAKKLMNLSITGNTNNLVSPELLKVKKELDSEFGLDTFMILSTGKKLANGGFDFQQGYATNNLPSEINFKKELGFKILNGKGTDANNFIASKESDTLLKEVFIEWSKPTATQIDKFIHVNKDDLATQITLSGNTKDLKVSIKPKLLKSNVNGILDENGTYEGLEVYFSLINIKWANTKAMPLDVFLEYISNQLVLSGSDVQTSKGVSIGSLYSFNQNNYKVKYDGTWGTDNIRVQYKAKKTYAILKAQKVSVKLSDISREAVKRYLDISSLITEAKKIKVTGDSTLGWWNKATGKYDLKNKWNGYIDNKKLKWSVAATKIINPNLYVDILYSVTNGIWLKTLPNNIVDKNSERHISFKYVWNKKKYNVENGVIISDSTVHDITKSSGIQNVLTYVDIKSSDLTKVQIIGEEKNGITVDKSKANLPKNTHLEFSISNFKDFDWSDSSDLGVTRLKSLGFKEGHKLLKDLDSSMTKDQLNHWITNLYDVTHHENLDGTPVSGVKQTIQIKRSWISIRIVADTGYSIRQTEDKSKRVNGEQNQSIVDKFFSIIEVVNLLNNKGFKGIQFSGQQTVSDGVVVSLPDSLTEASLLNKRIKLQYSLIPTVQKDELKEGAVEWNDIQSKNIPANTVKGQVLDVKNGFRVTITPFAKGESFFWVRLVPIVDDLSSAPITNDTVSNKTKHTVEWYENQTHTFLNSASQIKWIRSSTRLDTSNIPVVVNTDSKVLKLIAISGHTHDINIFEDVDGLGPDKTAITTKIATINTDASLQTKVLVQYTIDYINGYAIKKSVANEIQDKKIKPVWLNKFDFTSYLKGNLKVTGNSIVYKINVGSKKVGDKITMDSADMQNWITSRKLKTNDDITPIYNNLNIHTIFTKWSSISQKFIVSDNSAINIDFSKNDPNQRFRKWIDGAPFLKQLETVNVSGTTKSKDDYIINIKSKHNLLQKQFLNSMNLKLQYSPDKQNWTDDKFNFQSLKYQQQKDRKVYIRVAVKADPTSNAQSTWYRNDETLIVFGNFENSELKTGTTTNGVRDFKYWVNVNANELSKVIIQGNSIQLSGKKIEDSSVDNDQNKYSDVDIRYLYGGKWSTKADLLAALIQLRNKFKNHKVGTPWPTLPTDFTNASVKAKWILKQKSDAIMKMGQEIPFEINTKTFKTWVNIWDIQKNATKKYTTSKGTDLEFSDLMGGEGKDYVLSGTVNKVSMSRIGNLKDSILNSHNVKLQWSVSENPNNHRDSTDWKNAASLTEVTFNTSLNPQHKSLYIRLITKNVNFVASTQDPKTWGNADGIIPVRIDASKLVYEIGVHHNDLKSIKVSGDTQALFQTNGDKFFLEGNFPEESQDGKSGIRYETVDSNGKIITVPKSKRKEWIKTVGLNIIYTATTTRTRGTYSIQNNPKNINKYSGTLLEFKELIKKGFNFDRSTLTMKWTSTKKGFQVYDDTEAKPSDLSQLVNVIFTTDVTKLTSKSYNLFNNTLLLKAGVNDQKLNQLPTGLKIQWTTDVNPNKNSVIASNPKWLNKMPLRIPEHRSVFIRFANIDKNYKLTSDPKIATPEQVTKLDSSKVRIAIPLDKKFVSDFKNSSVTGKTYKINWNNPLAIVPDSQDGKKHGHIEYTVDDKTWHLHILAFQGMPAGETAAITDYYGKGIASLDKDLHKLKIRYIINKADQKEYIFSTTAGVEIPKVSLTKLIKTKSLIQPIIIDTEDKNLPIIKSTNKHMTWKYFAKKANKLKPIFVAGNKDRTASLTAIKFDGNDINQNGHSYYKLDVNKWDPKDILKRDLINALAPRHAHFEFKTIEVDPKTNPNAWTQWSKDLPQNIKTSTRFKGLSIKIAADDGYEIPDSKMVTPQFGDQTFVSDYNVIIELDVNGIKVTSATFEGFNNPQNPSARFLTNNKTGNLKKDNPLIDVEDKNGNKIPPTPEKPSSNKPDRWKGFVLEYRVKRGGKDVSWTDSNNVTKSGWHNFGQAPDSSLPWFGYVPLTLMEKDIVEYRLRARDGYLLIDDDPTLVRDKAGYVQFSHILGATEVKNLSKEIIIPKHTHIYNKDSLFNTNGDAITDDIKMPTAIFGGNEGAGTVQFDKRNFVIKDKVDIEVQVLHPIAGAINSGVTSNQFAENGYYVLNDKGVRTDVLTHINNKYIWLKNSEYLEGTWQKPSAINNLSVSDAIRVRFVARPGYGFMWENRMNDPIKDIMFPKKYSKDAFNSSQESYDVRSIFNASQTKGIPAPLPVRGLFVLPSTTPQKAKLTLSKNPTERISGNAVYSINPKPQKNEKWKWNFTLINSKGTQKHLSSIPVDLKNGDTIEVTIVTINSSYKLEPNYKANLKPLKFVVSGLKESIDVSSIPSPIPVIKGRVGHGVIVDITESINNGNSYDRTNSTVLPKPKLGSKYTGYKGKGLKWQYQYSQVNPSSLTEAQLKALPWTDIPPKDLNNGEYIRMKLSPKDSDDIAVMKTVTGQRKYLYSKPGQYKNIAGVIVYYLDGWRKIEGLELNPDNIKIIHKIIGFKSEGILSAKADGKTLDGEGVLVEASYDNGNTWHEPSFFKNLDNSTPLKGVPTNNFLRFRVKPKPGYVLNPKDNNSKKGIHIFKDNTTGSWYLEKDEWKKIRIDNLKEQLIVNRVNISKLIQTGKYDGDGSIKEPTLENVDTVTDRKKSTIDPVTKKPYSSYLKIKYVVKKLDSSTGQVVSETTIWDSKKLPAHLYNGDFVSAELYIDEDNNPETPSQFSLSNSITKSITISNLITKIKRIEKPSISFIGKSGYGSALVSPNAPHRTRWQFTVIKKTSGQFKPPADNTLTWLDESPTNLQVGDHVKVRLINSVSLVPVEQVKFKKDANGKLVPVLVKDPKTGKMVQDTEKVMSDWVTVLGLKEIIDLSTIVIRAVDNKNLQKPNKTITNQVAFVIKGTQSGFSKVSLNKTIKNLFDINNKPIPHSDSLTWEFARQTESDKKSYSWEERHWSNSMPQNVKNGEHVFARLIIKDDPKYSELEAYGFRPISFVVKGLTTASKISSKTGLLIIIIVGITTIIGIVSGILVTIKLRKKMKL